ncbi:MAG: SpoIIE family protein phosphatase [bacterium]
MTSLDWNLVGVVGGKQVRHALGGGVHLVGRADDATLKLAEPSVSRRHAEIIVEGAGVRVRDLGSHNGTKLNAAAVDGNPVPVRPGDVLEFAHVSFRVEAGRAGSATDMGLTMLNESHSLVPSAELSWDEFRTGHGSKQDKRSQLFRVLAEAGDLLTAVRTPAELFDPILDLVEAALGPERTFLMLRESAGDEPQVVAARVPGERSTDSLALSRTMMDQVLSEKKSFLTSDPLNDPGGGMMSMISLGIRSAIAVPLFDNEEVIGLLYADDTRAGKRFERDELAACTMLANVIAVALTRARLHALEEEKRRQDAELQAAGDILDGIIPAELPACPGYEAFARIQPCFEVGGDLYDAHLMADGRYVFLVGDVSGKGMGAALLVSHILSVARFMIEEGWEPLAMMHRLNREIFRITDFLRFATIFVGYLTPATGRIEYVNAGHNPPLVLRRDGRVDTCPATGMPVGVLDEAVYRSGELVLEPGDMISLFSDGIPETQRIDDEDEFGDERFQEFLLGQRNGELEGVFGRIQEELAAYREDAPVGDDITLLLLRRTAVEESPA